MEQGFAPADTVEAGRPYMVAGIARTAPVAMLDGWKDATTPRVPAEPTLRGELAARWARIAAFEHASVASFARFTLDLLAVGAPAELVVAAQKAGGDEVRHARLCFGLASAFEGRPVGPGALRVPDEPGRNTDLASLTAATVREGCVAETLAALEIAAAAEAARDPVVRDVLQRIAADEATHSELAWRFVRWALGAGGPEVRAAAAGAFGDAERAWSMGVASDDEAALEPWGILGSAARRRVQAQGLADVVLPAARLLLGEVEKAAPEPNARA